MHTSSALNNERDTAASTAKPGDESLYCKIIDENTPDTNKPLPTASSIHSSMLKQKKHNYVSQQEDSNDDNYDQLDEMIMVTENSAAEVLSRLENEMPNLNLQPRPQRRATAVRPKTD